MPFDDINDNLKNIQTKNVEKINKNKQIAI